MNESYLVRFTLTLALVRGERSADSDVQHIEGTIYYTDEDDVEHEVGFLRIYKIPEGMDLITASDISSDCQEVLTDIFDMDGDLKPAVRKSWASMAVAASACCSSMRCG